MEHFHFRVRHRVISNPIRLDAFRPLPQRQLLKAKFDFSDFTILYAGRLAPEKRVDLLVRAVAGLVSEVPAVRLALLGRGSAESDLISLCRSLGMAERVRFLGFLPSHTTVAEAYNAADVFAIASTAETQSIATMQAMACGLPVVGVRAWGLGEYINETNGLLVDPGDVGALGKALTYLAAHPEARVRLGREGQKCVTRFSAPAIATEWEEIYQAIATDFQHRRSVKGVLSGRDRDATDIPFRGTDPRPSHHQGVG
jgi:glycosyltransferase involved in cell wall biosynthesis